MHPYQLVDGRESNPLPQALSLEERIGVDTEFMRETTYFPQLCLVQIATGEKIFCADPLGELDLADFWRALVQPSWVVHSGRQDVEVLFLASGLMPDRIFDTQIAAALLGYAPQLGYGALVAQLFNVELAKRHTRADWSRRPLAKEFLRYAAEDVEYLLPAYDLLSARLSREGRLHWAEEDARDLLDRSLYAPDPDAAVLRMKGARYLRGRARRAAERLAAWREREALRLDRPRQWILKDAVLLALAVAGPAGEAALARIEDLPPKVLRRSGSELLAILANAKGDPPSPEDYQPPPPRDETEKKLLKPMLALVADTARELDIQPEVIASRKDLTAALHGERKLRVFRGWRRGLVGDKLLELLGSE
ncbi:MAG TPA: ribonuclease D [Woeseiaceae bacterium]